MSQELQTIYRVYSNLLKFIQQGEDSLTKSEIVELAEYSQLPSFLELTKSLEDLAKSKQNGVGDPTRHPVGAPGSQKNQASDASMKPGAIPGAPSPSSLATTLPSTSAKTAVSTSAKTAPAGKPVPPNAVYLKPGQKAPKGASVETTARGAKYYVPTAGGSPATQEDKDAGNGAFVDPHGDTHVGTQLPTSPGHAKTTPVSSEQPTKVEGTAQEPVISRSPPTLEVPSYAHDKAKSDLSVGVIESISPISSTGLSDSFKIKIKDDGEGILKPPMVKLTIRETDDTGADVVKPIDMLDPHTMGAGSGQLNQLTTPAREEATHLVAALHGMPDLVPPTVLRSHNGEVHSVQQWRSGFKSLHEWATSQNKNLTYKNVLSVAKSLAPPTKSDQEVEQGMMDLAVFNCIVNDADSHLQNILFDDNGNVMKIDGSCTFCTGLTGSKNELLHAFGTNNKRVTLSDTLRNQLKNKTFSDYKRAMPNLQEWEAGQTFLRNRYVLWLEANEGHIDPDKFVSTINDNRGLISLNGDIGWSRDKKEARAEFLRRMKNGHLPNQLFESWAKAFMYEASADSSHPDHEDAKTLLDMGVFMEPGYNSDPDYRKKGLHKKYQDSIVPSYDIPKQIRV